jgi:hypothetical protein
MKIETEPWIVEVARRLGLPVRAERIPCPRHPREAPAAVLDVRAQRFRCPRCRDVEGDAVDLVMLVRGLGRRRARRWLARGADEVEAVDEALLRLGVSTGPEHAAACRWTGVSAATLDRLGARVVADYRHVMLALERAFPPETLRESGLFNARGHLIFYRHRLILPYRDEGRVVHVVGLGPGELHPRGREIPLPFHAEALEDARGEVMLCAAVRDALLFEEWGCPAVAVPEPPGLRPEWLGRFEGRRILVLAQERLGGRAEAERRAERLRPVAASAEVVEVPGPGGPEGFLRGLGGGGP